MSTIARGKGGRPEGGADDNVIVWLIGGNELFLRHLIACEGALDEPSRLPGWSRAHVAAHVANNADALCNLLAWAKSGIERPMYESPAARTGAIMAGAGRSGKEIINAVRRSISTFDQHVGTMDDDSWDARVNTTSGRSISAREIPWLRVRELWIHTLDLEPGLSAEGFPPRLVDALIADVSTNLAARPVPPLVHLDPIDRAHQAFATTAGEVSVRGRAGDLLTWLTGRGTPDELGLSAISPIPPLPAWL